MAGGIAIQARLNNETKTAQGEQANALLQSYVGTLETAPNDMTALYGRHILLWRANDRDAALASFRRLIFRTLCHPKYSNISTSHLDRASILALADAYFQSHPAEPWGYMMAIIIQRRIFCLDLVEETIQH